MLLVALVVHLMVVGAHALAGKSAVEAEPTSLRDLKSHVSDQLPKKKKKEEESEEARGKAGYRS